MEYAAAAARFGNKILGLIAGLFILLMLAYGGYSLWDTFRVFNGAFLDSEITQFKPEEGVDNRATLEELMKINPDVIGWITVDDTHIDYPLLQGEDDLEYVNKDVYGDFSLSGAIFLSYVNKPDLTDHFNLIYGHHMDNGGMLGDVLSMIDKEYFDSHEKGHIFLPDRTYELTLFALLETDAYDSMIYIPTDQSDVRIQMVLDYVRQNATHYRDIGITKDDSFVALSTCKDATTNGRGVAFLKLTEVKKKDTNAQKKEYQETEAGN